MLHRPLSMCGGARAEVLDPIREGRPLVLAGGELSRAMGGGSLGRIAGRRAASSLSQALVADASPRG